LTDFVGIKIYVIQGIIEFLSANELQTLRTSLSTSKSKQSHLTHHIFILTLNKIAFDVMIDH